MWIRKHIDDIEDHEIPPDVFKSVLTSVLGAYSEFRPDVGFIAGLEKIAAHFLLIFLPYQNFETEDFSLEGIEYEIFKLLCTLTMSESHHLSSFLMSDFDEISWRLDYFD